MHKAIKYGIWSSTERGNKILDSAYVEVMKIKRNAHEHEFSEAEFQVGSAEVYLFFSVNKSKHFCGVAKMIGRVQHFLK